MYCTLVTSVMPLSVFFLLYRSIPYSHRNGDKRVPPSGSLSPLQSKRSKGSCHAAQSQQGAETHQLVNQSGEKAYLRQPFTVIWTLLLPPQTGGHEPETHIDKFRLGGINKGKVSAEEERPFPPHRPSSPIRVLRETQAGGRGLKEAEEHRLDHTSMTNSNPSRFFSSSTRYL